MYALRVAYSGRGTAVLLYNAIPFLAALELLSYVSR